MNLFLVCLVRKFKKKFHSDLPITVTSIAPTRSSRRLLKKEKNWNRNDTLFHFLRGRDRSETPKPWNEQPPATRFSISILILTLLFFSPNFLQLFLHRSTFNSPQPQSIWNKLTKKNPHRVASINIFENQICIYTRRAQSEGFYTP